MSKGFNLADVLSGVSTMDTGSNAGQKQIEYIEEDRIFCDERNFYALDGIEELAANIELVGLQQPILVRRDPDSESGYVIVSGHRRMTAIRTILKPENPKQWERIPCIVDGSCESAAMQELRLIYANASTREKSSSDKAKEVERVQALLYQLKEEGVAFPGRMRDHVAEACNVSRTRIARLNVITTHLIPGIKKFWENGTVSESVAYMLAQMPEDDQNLMLDQVKKDGRLYQSTLDVWKRRLDSVSKFKSKSCSECDHIEVLRRRVVKSDQYSYVDCAGVKCCSECRKLASCKDACPKLAERVKQLKLDAKELKLQEQAEREERERPKVQRIMTLWNRFGEARARADKSVEECFHALDRYYSDSSEEEVVQRECLEGKFHAETKLPYGYCCYLGDVERYVKIADLLDVSIDYLLCRTDNPQGFCQQPEGQLAICGWMPGGTYPRESGDVAAVFDAGAGVILKKICYYADGQFFFKKSGAVINAKCVKWLQLPQDE